MSSYLKLLLAVLLPALASSLLYILNKKTAFGKMHDRIKQLIYGLSFGGIAIIGTEWGIPMNGAQMNCRDAAVLTAGLLFGAPAGIIAGVIGGAERWIAVVWGVGTYTRTACTVSTVMAGVYSALLRKYMFDDKKPGLWISLEIGIVMEVFHLTMIFVTNMSTIDQAIEVVKSCTVPMIAGNGLSVMLSVFALMLLSGEQVFGKKQDRLRISQTVQRWMLLAVTLAFLLTSAFVFQLQTKAALTQTDNLLSLSLSGAASDINETSDDNLLHITKEIGKELNAGNYGEVAEKYQVAEISFVDENGIIKMSSVPEYIGFDMHSGKQSADFLCLLSDETEYVQEYGPIARDADIKRKYAGIRYGQGFLQVGYDAEQFQNDIDSEVVGFTKYSHVGESGYIIIIDANLQPVSFPEGMNLGTLNELAEDLEKAGPDSTAASRINGEKVYCRYSTVEGYYLVSVLPAREVWKTRDIAVYINVFLEIMVFAVLFAEIYMLIKRVVVNQIDRINASLDKITDGHLDEVVNVRSNSEFASLSDDINQTVDTLKRYIAEASARIDEELEIARNIQLSALPNIFPAFPKRRDFDIFAATAPAKEVGGDFYDLYMTGENKLNFVIADVSGKGIPGAMFMMRAKTELKSLTETGIPLCDVFRQGNAALCEGNDVEMFVTAWQAGIDLESGKLEYVNAGHNPPLLCRNGKYEFITGKPCFVLAGMEGMKYRTEELKLLPGDILFLYTDGVPEAADASGAFYGNDRLLKILDSAETGNMEELCRIVKDDVDSFVGEAAQFDDITMLAFKYIGESRGNSMKIERAVLDDLGRITEFVEGELEKLECPVKAVMQIDVAVDEIFSNIIKHGYQEGAGPVTVSVEPQEVPKAVKLKFTDKGIPYNPLLLKDPDISLSADERSVGGLGIFLVRKTMDDVRYAYENGCNILTIEKRF